MRVVNNSLEFIAETHRSKIEMSSDLKYSIIQLFNFSTNLNFKSFQLYQETNNFKTKLNNYNNNLLKSSYDLIKNEIKGIELVNLNFDKVKEAFLANKIWDLLKSDEKYAELFDRFIGKKYIISGLLLSVVSLLFVQIIGWWEIVILIIIYFVFFILDQNENIKKFKYHKKINKSKFEVFENIIKESKPTLLK